MTRSRRRLWLVSLWGRRLDWTGRLLRGARGSGLDLLAHVAGTVSVEPAWLSLPGVRSGVIGSEDTTTISAASTLARRLQLIAAVALNFLGRRDGCDRWAVAAPGTRSHSMDTPSGTYTISSFAPGICMWSLSMTSNTGPVTACDDDAVSRP